MSVYAQESVAQGRNFRPLRVWCILWVFIGSVNLQAIQCKDIFPGLTKRKQKILQLSEGEKNLRTSLIKEKLSGSKTALPLPPEEQYDRVLSNLNAKLLQENRLLSSLTEEERQELVSSVLSEVEKQVFHQGIEHEAALRIKFVEHISKEKENEKVLLLDILRKKLQPFENSLRKVPETEEFKLFKEVKREFELRRQKTVEELARQKKQNQRPWILGDEAVQNSVLQILEERLSSEGKSFEALSVAEQKAQTDAAFREFAARLAAVEKKVDESVAETGNPWNWQILWQKPQILERVLAKLHEDLTKQNRNFLSFNRGERELQASGHVSSTLASYQDRPTLKVAGVGLGVPILMGYAGSMAVPEVVRPAWYIITGILAGPFTFGVNYYFNGLLKPIFSLNKQKKSDPLPSGLLGKEMQRLMASNPKALGPFAKDMSDIGANSTGVPDPFKDGRNISKDGEIPLRDSLNDAMRIENRDDAEKAVAAALLYHRSAFPEVRLNQLAVNSLRLKIKSRFSDGEAVSRIEKHIKELATDAEEDPKSAIEELKILTGN